MLAMIMNEQQQQASGLFCNETMHSSDSACRHTYLDKWWAVCLRFHNPV